MAQKGNKYVQKTFLESLPTHHYLAALKFTREQCYAIADLARVSKESLSRGNPGQDVLNIFEKLSLPVYKYKSYLNCVREKKVFYKPSVKIAIIIGIYDYTYLQKLSAPEKDCEKIAFCLKYMGFNVVKMTNMSGTELRSALDAVIRVIPENSYCFIMYAGHGFQIKVKNTPVNYFMGKDCPTENVRDQHCLSQNHLLEELQKRKPELCVLVMDTCRVESDLFNKDINKPHKTFDYTSIKNLLICNSTEVTKSACERQVIIKSTTTGTKRQESTSLYIDELSRRVTKDADVDGIFDKIHRDQVYMQQKPTKEKYGSDKRSLSDPVIHIDNCIALHTQLRSVTANFGKHLVKVEMLNCTCDTTDKGFCGLHHDKVFRCDK